MNTEVSLHQYYDASPDTLEKFLSVKVAPEFEIVSYARITTEERYTKRKLMFTCVHLVSCYAYWIGESNFQDFRGEKVY